MQQTTGESIEKFITDAHRYLDEWIKVVLYNRLGWKDALEMTTEELFKKCKENNIALVQHLSPQFGFLLRVYKDGEPLDFSIAYETRVIWHNADPLAKQQ